MLSNLLSCGIALAAAVFLIVVALRSAAPAPDKRLLLLLASLAILWSVGHLIAGDLPFPHDPTQRGALAVTKFLGGCAFGVVLAITATGGWARLATTRRPSEVGQA